MVNYYMKEKFIRIIILTFFYSTHMCTDQASVTLFNCDLRKKLVVIERL